LLQRGPVVPKFQVEGVDPTNHSSSQKTRLNILSYGIKIWTDLSTVLSQFTRVTDGQSDKTLIAIPRLHYMQRGKKGNLTTNDFCDDYTSVLGVYTDVLFAEDRGLKPCLGEKTILAIL